MESLVEIVGLKWENENKLIPRLGESRNQGNNMFMLGFGQDTGFALRIVWRGHS